MTSVELVILAGDTLYYRSPFRNQIWTERWIQDKHINWEMGQADGMSIYRLPDIQFLSQVSIIAKGSFLLWILSFLSLMATFPGKRKTSMLRVNAAPR